MIRYLTTIPQEFQRNIMSDLDVEWVMNGVKSFCKDYFAKQTNENVNEGDVVSVTATKLSARGRGGKVDDVVCNFTEVPEFMIQMLQHHTKLMMERQDSKINEAVGDLVVKYEEKLTEKDELITELKQNLRDTENKLDALGQYTRRENIRIEGIEYNEGENLKDILKDITETAGGTYEESNVSVIHRIGVDYTKRNGGQNQPNATAVQQPGTKKKIPSIIVRYARRDAKIDLFENRKNLTTNANCPAYLKNTSIYEDVTPLRSRMMFELRQRGDRKEFKYVWSRGGRIYCRTPEEAERRPMPAPHIINKPEDLREVGFTDTEIDTIIKSTRK